MLRQALPKKGIIPLTPEELERRELLKGIFERAFYSATSSGNILNSAVANCFVEELASLGLIPKSKADILRAMADYDGQITKEGLTTRGIASCIMQRYKCLSEKDYKALKIFPVSKKEL
jgi:hypothetical protein